MEGTLSIPRGAAGVPAVVLLAGSGSLDRDETIGRNKPFKDIAWGLATNGVAVLRFDKVTYTHAGEVKNADRFTLSDEYLPHALAALECLRARAAIDQARIFLLGHSLGGTVAPRVAAAEPSVAGLILLAGGAQPLHWVLVRQFTYLASLRGARLVLARPARLQPAALAATLGKPVLILQGARDYQVTVRDDLALWQAALSDRPEVTVRVYPELNHLFAPGSGPSIPAEYEPRSTSTPA